MNRKEVITAQLPSYESQKMPLKLRIKAMRKTVHDLEVLPPALGGKWREGMLRYYGDILTELESYGISDKNPK